MARSLVGMISSQTPLVAADSPDGSDEMTRVSVTAFDPEDEVSGWKNVLYDVDEPAATAVQSVVTWLEGNGQDPTGDVAMMVRNNFVSPRPQIGFQAIWVARSPIGLAVVMTWDGAQLPEDLEDLAARPARDTIA